MYENARREVLDKREPPSWASERVRQYGLAGLFPDFQRDFPFILYRQSVLVRLGSASETFTKRDWIRSMNSSSLWTGKYRRIDNSATTRIGVVAPFRRALAAITVHR